ncbi:MAG: DUF2142 domain-containing protein [Methanobrevibacter millerae]|uniref:DUF2142 domain-containing protein n=1 Tax=Methanobrevibacter millerae TaxID=230361 RepID=A0A8T3VAN5_9EURY|nr:DUF2142 domain-containing protein [Methanobrevibacter millerae]MBE6504797.1 DUF2142 domain-containing protein [Methanobrevibacter millerae]
MKFLELKNYYVLYLLIIVFFTVSFLQIEDYSSPGFEIIILALMFVWGAFSLYYYTQNEDNLHKVAFVIILLFGITCVFLTPINDISDEQEHCTRSEIVSTGQILTDYVQVPNQTFYGYLTIKSVDDLAQNAGNNVFNTNVDDGKIDYSPVYLNSAFSQNPFYSYLPQALGFFLAKILDLNVIWMLWLGRLFNLLFYASVITLAIKKAPILKFPLLIISILPLAIYQAASLSVDGMFSCLAILAFSYFLYFYKTPKIKWVDIGIFYLAIVLCGLLKSPFLALSLLLFLVPRENFESKRQNIISKLAILPLLAIGIMWSNYATTVLVNSWRGEFFAKNHVNAAEQVANLINNPIFALERFLDPFTRLPLVVDRFFLFSNDVRQYTSSLLAILYLIFFIAFSLLCPLDEKFDIKTRVKGLVIGLIIYYGVIFVQYLTWSSVGGTNALEGVFSRYFMPLLIFIPFIINKDFYELDRKKIFLLFLTIALSFISGMIMLTVSVKY